MVTLYFTKRFVSGPLKGLTYNDTLTFETYEQGHKWATDHRTKPVKPLVTFSGCSAYLVVDASFQNYTR